MLVLNLILNFGAVNYILLSLITNYTLRSHQSNMYSVYLSLTLVLTDWVLWFIIVQINFLTLSLVSLIDDGCGNTLLHKPITLNILSIIYYVGILYSSDLCLNRGVTLHSLVNVLVLLSTLETAIGCAHLIWNMDNNWTI